MKTYVITGGTSGIGEALVNYFSKDNIVFCGYRNEKKLPDELSENIIPFYVDYANPNTIQGAVEFITSKTDKIDTLINVAGCVVAGAIENIPVSELRRQFDVNVFGAVELSQGLLDNLNNGKIINISSMASYGLFPFISPYCASKRALDILFNSAASLSEYSCAFPYLWASVPFMASSGSRTKFVTFVLTTENVCEFFIFIISILKEGSNIE